MSQLSPSLSPPSCFCLSSSFYPVPYTDIDEFHQAIQLFHELVADQRSFRYLSSLNNDVREQVTRDRIFGGL